MGQELIPQICLFGLFPQIVEPGRHFPQFVLLERKFLPIAFSGIDKLLYKRLKFGI